MKIYNSGLKPCPFCGAEVFMTKNPLWQGSHGYHGDYEYYVKCDKCGGTKNFQENDTIYHGIDIEVQKNITKQWNQRPNEDE